MPRLTNNFSFKFYSVADGNKQSNKTSSALPPEEQALTEAELRFMSEQMGDTDSECKNLSY